MIHFSMSRYSLDERSGGNHSTPPHLDVNALTYNNSFYASLSCSYRRHILKEVCGITISRIDFSTVTDLKKKFIMVFIRTDSKPSPNKVTRQNLLERLTGC